MSNVTYLLGAGASQGALPLANEIAFSIDNIADKVRDTLVVLQNEYGVTEKDFCEDLKNFSKKSAKHKTVDTYAKKLYAIEADKEFYELKCILSAYFSLKQLEVGRCDDRYDGFFASLIQNKYNEFPKNVRIITWNYDIQMEIAYREFCPEHRDGLESIRQALNIVTNNNSDYSTDKARHGFGIFKLNGTANVYRQFEEGNNRNEEKLVHSSYENGWSIYSIRQIIKQYFYLKNNQNRAKPTITFAWEHQNFTGNQTVFTEQIRSYINDTEIIVIIGYSFPFFNRPVDKELFKTMTGAKRIYIQDTNPSAVKASLGSIIDDYERRYNNGFIRIEEISEVGQFFLPPEL